MEQLVNLGAIVVDPALQPRQQMDMAMVLEYAGEMQAGAQFPAVTAFGTVEQCWLADGFHRIEAAKMSQLPVVRVELKPGGRREAQLFSLGANATHGLRRTNADKRRAVETALRDAEWTLWSDREIASRCMVSAPLVAQVRMELGLTREERKVERGGVVYTMQTAMIGKEGEQGQDFQDERIGEEEVSVDEEGEISFVDEGELRSVEQDGEGEVEFGDEYVERAQAEVRAVEQDMGVEEREAGGAESLEDSVLGRRVGTEEAGEVQEAGAWVAPTLPAPARTAPVLVPPAQAIPAPKLPEPEKPAPVVVLVARIRGDVADVTIGQEGTMPSYMRKASAEREDLVEVLSQLLRMYFNAN